MTYSKFNETDVERAIEDLSMLRFFPSEAGAQAAIGRMLARMVPHKEALRWLVDTMINRVGEWKGPMELRGVLCTRYKPADGVEANSAIPGFTPEDGEERSFEQHQQLKAGSWDAGEPPAALPDPINVAAIATRKRLPGRVM